jgi:hypothetical protein
MVLSLLDSGRDYFYQVEQKKDDYIELFEELKDTRNTKSTTETQFIMSIKKKFQEKIDDKAMSEILITLDIFACIMRDLINALVVINAKKNGDTSDNISISCLKRLNIDPIKTSIKDIKKLEKKETEFIINKLIELLKQGGGDNEILKTVPMIIDKYKCMITKDNLALLFNKKIPEMGVSNFRFNDIVNNLCSHKL